jgi:hypothetical protein
VTVGWGQGLSEDGRKTFDTDLTPEELDRLFETGKSADDSGFWIVVE